MTTESRDLIEQLQRRVKHLERLLSRYKVEWWEELQQGDKVIIDNSDSRSDGKIGTFVDHDWIYGGWCELIVELSFGERFTYLPSQLQRYFEDEIGESASAKRRDEETPTPTPTPTSATEIDPSILAKLETLHKFPLTTRKAILTGSLDSSLHEQAIALAIERGLMPPYHA